MPKISQRAARRLQSRVYELENTLNRQRSKWVVDYPGGVHLGYITRDRDWLSGRIEAARLLGHAIVATEGDDGHLHFYALPQGEGHA